MGFRKVEIGSENYTKILCKFERDVDAHDYEVIPKDGGSAFLGVSFQNGPVKEAGVNGCHNEDLIAIVIDRLQYFQKGEFSCRENALALTKLEEAMHWLKHRTDARIKRGVEGLNIK